MGLTRRRSAAPLRAAVLASLVTLAGCVIPFRIELATPADTLRWQNEITTEVNNHDKRLQALEGEKHADHPAAQ